MLTKQPGKCLVYHKFIYLLTSALVTQLERGLTEGSTVTFKLKLTVWYGRDEETPDIIIESQTFLFVDEYFK